MWQHTLVPVVAHDRTTTARRDADLARLRRELGRDPRSRAIARLRQIVGHLDDRLLAWGGQSAMSANQRELDLAA